MKLALKYGLIITVGFASWVIAAHALVSDPHSSLHGLGAVTFSNLLHFAVIYLGIRALEREKGEKPTFKEGLKQGVRISFVYAVTSALFFVGVLLMIGTKWMAGEAPGNDTPMWLVGLKAFAGLLGLIMIFGLVYSTLLSFLLARRLTSDE